MTALENLNGKTIAITGASGYIGSAIADALATYSSTILAVSREGMAAKPGMMSMRADIRTPECWTEIVSRADVIFHLAGNTSAYAAARDPAESLNSTVLPINHLVRAARELGDKPKVVYSSTATVYGLTDTLPVAETLVPKPITVYDLHKHFAEQQLALATQQDVIDSVSLRLANVYGPSSSTSSANDRGILNKITALAIQQQDLNIFGDGNYLRDYVYIDDVVNAFLLASVTPGTSGLSFNVATGIGTTIREAFEMVTDRVALATGHRVRTNFRPWPSDADTIELRSFVASTERFFAATGWRATVNLSEGITKMISDNPIRLDRQQDP